MSEGQQRNAVFALAEGDVALQFPAELSAESVSFVEEYFALVLRGMRRRAENNEACSPARSAEDGGSAS